MKKSRAFHASPLNVNEKMKPGPDQLILASRKVGKTYLHGSPLSGELPEPTIIICSDPSMRSIPHKDLSPLGEEISLLQNVFLVKYKRE